MKNKKILLLVMLLLPVISVTNVSADYTIPTESLETGNTAFFLGAANNSQTLEINLTRSANGNFTMYLLSKRPISTTIDNTAIIGEDFSDNPTITHAVTENKIYYIQINLVDTGPDMFTISCTHNLVRYYLPQIPGFPLEIIFISLITGFGLVYILHKKKIKSL